MAASPWACLSLAVCLMVTVSVSTGNVVPQDEAQSQHHRVARQLSAGDLHEKADAAKEAVKNAAAKGAQRAHAAAESAQSHIAERVRRSIGIDLGSTGEGLDSWLFSSGAVVSGDYRPRRSLNERRDVRSRERAEAVREREERVREREDVEREREGRERERERDETKRERGNRARERERERDDEERRRDRE